MKARNCLGGTKCQVMLNYCPICDLDKVTSPKVCALSVTGVELSCSDLLTVDVCYSMLMWVVAMVNFMPLPVR